MAELTIEQRRKQKKGAPPTFPVIPISELERVRIFREIPKQALLVLEGSVRKANADPDETILELVSENEFFRYFFFIVKGQVRVVGLDEDARPRPLNFLRKGEFFVDKAISWHGQIATKVIAITEVELLVVPRNELRLLAQQYPLFQEKLKTLSERIDFRNRIYCEDKYSKSVLDFLIDTALTQASRVKITQMDKCIECNTCYQSCEDRHGFQRLSRGYAHFGTLDFAQSCLTCFYPTCIPACPVDSVIYNTKKGEVEILDSCIGCSACARACQYGAIKMYKVEQGDPKFKRFLAKDKKVKPKFIADKCNHCEGYEDMVCITNCPTGAIMEVEATELLENPKIFGVGERIRQPLPSLTDSGWLNGALRNFYIATGLLVTLLISWEAYALSRWQVGSILLALQRKGIIPSSTSIEFEQGSDFCIFLGNVGFTLILLAMLYPLRKTYPKLFKYIGKKPLWLDFHNFAGTLGTILVLFHTGFAFPIQGSTLGFVALVMVMLSGIFGRFLYQMIPRGVAGTELKMRDIEEEDASINLKLETLFMGETQYKAVLDRMVASITSTEVNKAPTLWSLIRAVLLSRYMVLRFRFHPPKELKAHRRQIGALVKLLQKKIRLKRNVVFLGLSSRLFARWQYIHRPFAYMMGTLAIGHVIYNLIYFKWNI